MIKLIYMEMNFIISALQTAVGPVILISGVGLLLLTMTNRLGRVIDRARSLSSGESLHRPEVQEQLKILILRAANLRRAIMLAVSSALMASLLVILIFLGVLWRIPIAIIVISVFVVAMSTLIGSLTLFMRDVNLSLEALHAKLKP